MWGRRFVVRTDHSALTWLLSFHEPAEMLARWISVLNTYGFSIIHRKGMNHGNADGLSPGLRSRKIMIRLQLRIQLRLPTPDFNLDYDSNSDSDSLVWAKYLS